MDKDNLPYNHAYINITIPYCYYVHYKLIQISSISIHRMVTTSIYIMALAISYGIMTAKQELGNPEFKSSSQTCRVIIILFLSTVLYGPLALPLHPSIQSHPIQPSCTPLDQPVEIHTRSTPQS
jgi:hypothetical protein